MLTEKQLEERKRGIGSSEIAAVAGLSPYAGPIDVWRAKVEGLRVEETPAMRRGTLLEPVIAQMYADETSAALELSDTLFHPSRPPALATPDRIAQKDGERWVLEIKTANLRMLDQWGEPGTDEVPQQYLAQVAWEMSCAGLERADLAVLIAGDEFRVYHLRRDAELEEMLHEEAERFWRDYVLTGQPPPIDGSDSCARWLAERYPLNRSPLLEATPEAEALALAYRKAREVREAAEEREQHARNQLCALIGDAEGLAGTFGKLTWKRSKDSARVDWEAVAKAAGAPANLIQQHTTLKPGPRVFRPTWKKG